MAYYVGVLKEKSDGGRPYNYGTCYLPHDGDRKSLASNDTPESVLYRNGFDVQIVPKTKNKALSIERARQVLPLCWFDRLKCATDTDKITSGVTHLDNYTKSWDDKLGTWKKEPLHNAASHASDAFLCFADHYDRFDEDEDDEDDRYARPGGRNPTTGY